jgi:hypothetical protein
MLVVAALTSDGLAGGRHRPVCGPRDAVTLVERGPVRVYRRSHRSPHTYARTRACDALNGFGDDLDADVYVFGPPAIGIQGEVIGWAYNDFSDPFSEQPATRVVVEDLARSGRGYLVVADLNGQSTLGSLRVTRAGIAAWITCDIQNDGASMRDCTRPGALAWVYRTTVDLTSGPGTSPLYSIKPLDSGHRIDPGSLRLAGTRLSWIHSGKRRYADLT